MEKYKISNTLEVLFNIKKEDSIQITSFSRASSYKEGNEEYIFTLLITRDAKKSAENRPSGKTPAGIIIP